MKIAMHQYRRTRKGNALILVVSILVLLVLVATAFITKTQSGRFTAIAQRDAARINDRAHSIGQSISDEIAIALFPRSVLDDGITSKHSANARRVAPFKGALRYGHDSTFDVDGEANSFNYAPYEVIPWTNPPDDSLFDGMPALGPYNPRGGPSFGDTRWLRDTEPQRADLNDMMQQGIFAWNEHSVDGTPETFTHWRHLTNLSRSGNGWRVVRDISNIAGNGLINDLDVPIEQWPINRPQNVDGIDLVVGSTMYPSLDYVGDGFVNLSAIQTAGEEHLRRWDEWFTLAGWADAQNNASEIPQNFLDLSDLNADGSHNALSVEDISQERPEDAYVRGTLRWYAELMMTDADGDGFTDSLWHLSPQSLGPDVRQIVAFSVTDNSARGNVNVATRFHRKDYYDDDSAIDQHGESTRGLTPADLALVGQNQPNLEEGNQDNVDVFPWRVGFMDSLANLPGNSNFLYPANTYFPTRGEKWVVYDQIGPNGYPVNVDWDTNQWKGILSTQYPNYSSLLDELGIEVNLEETNAVFFDLTSGNFLSPTDDITSRYGRLWYWQLAGRDPFNARYGLRPFTIPDELELRIAEGNNYQFVGSRFERSVNDIFGQTSGGEVQNQFLRSDFDHRHEASELRDQLDNRQLLFDNRRKLTMFNGVRNDLLPPWIRWEDRFWNRNDPTPLGLPTGYLSFDLAEYDLDFVTWGSVFPAKIVFEAVQAVASSGDINDAIDIAIAWREQSRQKIDLREYYSDSSFGNPWWESNTDGRLTLAERAPLQLLLAMTDSQEQGTGGLDTSASDAHGPLGVYSSPDPDASWNSIDTNYFQQTRLMAAGFASNLIAYRDADDGWRQHSVLSLHPSGTANRVSTPLSAAIAPPILGNQGFDTNAAPSVPYADVPVEGPEGEDVMLLGLEAQPFLVEAFIAHVHQAKLIDPVGACCLPDVFGGLAGGCVDVSESTCSGLLAGTFFPGDVCDPDGDGDFGDSPCQSQGACCVTGSCLTMSESACDAAFGDYFGDGIPCEATTCNGACCTDSGDCEDMSGFSCVQVGGAFQGNDTTCATAPCEKVGSCCMGSGTCMGVISSNACTSLGGTFVFGVKCADRPCVGACCVDFSDCLQVTEGGCDDINGTFLGTDQPCAGVTCVSSGACCIGSDSCHEVQSIDECIVLSGDFLAGAFCLDTPCSGSCCLGEGECQDISASSCFVLGGEFINGGECSVNPCRAACCLSTGGCANLLQQTCEAFNGTFIGDGLFCDTSPCVEGACCLSFNEAPGWINELHYDNASTDINEFVEIVLLDGIDPSTVTLTLYDGNGGTVYASYNVASDMTLGEDGTGYAIYSILHSGIQDGAPDGVSLDVSGVVFEFISYEGSMSALEGPASGMTSVDIRVSESSGTTVDSSLGRTGTGGTPNAFTWVEFVDLATNGASNVGQVISPGFDDSDDGCIEVTQGGCDTLGGEYQGDSVFCGSVPCGITTERGACCLPSGLCQNVVSEDVCNELGGVYRGEGPSGEDVSCVEEPCVPAWACCLSTTATCIDIIPELCDDIGGDFKTDSICADSPCEVACCFSDGTCEDILPSQCLIGGGTSNDQRFCISSPCENDPSVIGACCINEAPVGWINELHYDNASTDINEFVEIVLLDGIDPSTVTLTLYDGNGGTVYASYNVESDMTLGEVGTGYVIYSILHPGIQDGAPDGVSLDVSGVVFEFISYEGPINALDGPAFGMTSVDIGVSESSGTTVDSSLGRTGTGGTPNAFTWVAFVDLATNGASNVGQVISPGGVTTCDVMPLSDCSELDGTFQGSGTDCLDNCDLGNKGACCMSPLGCMVVVQSACDLAGGSWSAGACDTNACDTGSCCLEDGDAGHCLQVLNSAACDLLFGEFHAGESCASRSCLGACCIWGGDCVLISKDSCENLFDPDADGTWDQEDPPGLFNGVGSTCETNTCIPTGSCCMESDTCIDMMGTSDFIDYCTLVLGGTFRSGEFCAETECGGSCCLPDGTCKDISAIACITYAGTYQGTGVFCDTDPCGSVGVCCFVSGSCYEIFEDACTNLLGGDYQGDGTSCDTIACPSYFLVDNNPGDDGLYDTGDEACPQETVAVVQLANPFDRAINLTSYAVEFFGQEFKFSDIDLDGDGLPDDIILPPATPSNPATLILYSITADSDILDRDADDPLRFRDDWFDFLDIEVSDHPIDTNVSNDNPVTLEGYVGSVIIDVNAQVDTWSLDRNYYDNLNVDEQNSIALYKFDKELDSSGAEILPTQRVLIDRLDPPGSTISFEERVVFDLEEQWNKVGTGGYVALLDSDGLRIVADDSESALYVQWDRATRAWGADVPEITEDGEEPENTGWHNDVIDPWEHNPRYIFAGRDFIRSEEIMNVTNAAGAMAGNTGLQERINYASAFHWTEFVTPDDFDGDGNADNASSADDDLLADDPDAWFMVEVWSPRAGDVRTITSSEGEVKGELRFRKPTYFDMNHKEDPLYNSTDPFEPDPNLEPWSYLDKGWYGQRIDEDDDETSSDTPAFADDILINEFINVAEVDMAMTFPLQMLQKDEDFEQVGELLNVWLFGHMLEGVYYPTDTTNYEYILTLPQSPLDGGTAIDAGTITTFSEFMYPRWDSVEDWWAPWVATIENNEVVLDARVNRLRFIPVGDDKLPMMMDGRSQIVDSVVSATNHAWPRLSIAARVLDSFVCDGPGRPDRNGDGIDNNLDDLNPTGVVEDGSLLSMHPFYNANGFSGRATPGIININTAPVEVLRMLPHMYKVVHSTQSVDTGQLDSADRNPRSLIPESILQWREGANGYPSMLYGTGYTGGPDYSNRSYTLGLEFFDGPKETRGFSSPSEIGVLRPSEGTVTVIDDVMEPWHINTRHQAIRDVDSWRIDFAAAEPFASHDSTGFADFIGDGIGSPISTDVNFRNYYGEDSLVGDGISGDAEEINLLQAGMSNLISTTSDMFTVHLKIRTFRRNPITGIWNATDPDFIVDDSRYVLLVDRSNVDTPADKPKILYFEKLPN